jgi:DNA-binding NtrC family response regulator
VRLLRRRARVDGSDWGVVDASEQSDLELGMLLFGRGRDTPGMVEQHDGLPILIEPLDDLPRRWQRKLARLIDRGAVSRFRGARPIPAQPWILFLSRQSLDVLERDRILVPELARILQAREVSMPDIAAREGDLPELLAGLCRSHGSRVRFGPSAVSLMSRMSWPGQISDLRALIERLDAHNVSGEIGAADLDPFVSDRIAPPPVPKTLDADQKAWLLAVLRRHGFNRSAAARSLGISRKTLYNRLHRLGL